MIELRPAETDADLEAWRRVRIAVHPDERTASVEELRRIATPEQLLLIAELDGELVGSGVAGRADVGDRGFVIPRVVPDARRRGVGGALLRALADHVAALGYREAGSFVLDDGSLAFAERFGFRERNRDVEQVRVIGEEAPPVAPRGVTIVSVRERPELWRAAYAPLAVEAAQDLALDRPLDVSLERWEREWINWPEATFVAVAAGDVIGCAGLMRDDDQPQRAENAFTAVRRDWRGRGVATALKRTALAFAAANGIREVYTWTQRGNENMRRLNERLGYVTRSVSVRVLAPLPLP